MRKALPIAVPVALAGCQTSGPSWSEVNGQRRNPAIECRGPRALSRIDGVSTANPPPFRMDPDQRMLAIQGLPGGGYPNGNIVEFPLRAEPCKRYYLNEQHKNPIQPFAWPVIDYVADIAGCKLPDTPK